jgi:hypothetical protein
MSNESHPVRELRRDAKRLVKAVAARDSVAIDRIVAHHPRFKQARRNTTTDRQRIEPAQEGG